MGTWGVGPFESDGASDWVWELEKCDDLDVLAEALVLPEGYVEAPEGEIAIAAAAVLSAFAGDPVGVPDEVMAWVDARRHMHAHLLKWGGLNALDRVTSQESELEQEWSASPDSEEWHDALNRIRSALNRNWPEPAPRPAPTTPAAPPSTKKKWQFWR
jgi:hypothetical protein